MAWGDVHSLCQSVRDGQPVCQAGGGRQAQWQESEEVDEPRLATLSEECERRGGVEVPQAGQDGESGGCLFCRMFRPVAVGADWVAGHDHARVGEWESWQAVAFGRSGGEEQALFLSRGDPNCGACVCVGGEGGRQGVDRWRHEEDVVRDADRLDRGGVRACCVDPRLDCRVGCEAEEGGRQRIALWDPCGRDQACVGRCCRLADRSCPHPEVVRAREHGDRRRDEGGHSPGGRLEYRRAMDRVEGVGGVDPEDGPASGPRFLASGGCTVDAPRHRCAELGRGDGAGYRRRDRPSDDCVRESEQAASHGNRADAAWLRERV